MSTIPLMSDRHQSQAYPLRLPEDLKAKVAESAKANGRSFNAEVAARLQQSFEPTIQLHQSFGSLLDTGALQQQLDTTTKSLRLHEDATLIMHGLLGALLNEIPPDREETLAVKIARSFKQASLEQDMTKARAAWDALMEAGDPTILLAQAAEPSPKPD